MNKLANFSGRQVIAILINKFGFYFVSQKGSHVKLRKFYNEQTVTVIVPNHKELALGTLRNILKQANITPEDFLE